MKDELGRLQDSILGKVRALFGHKARVLFVLFALDDEDITIGHILEGDVGYFPSLFGYYMGRHLPPEVLDEFVGEMDMGLRAGRNDLWDTLLMGVGDEEQLLGGYVYDGVRSVDAVDSGDDKDLPEQPEEYPVSVGDEGMVPGED